MDALRVMLQMLGSAVETVVRRLTGRPRHPEWPLVFEVMVGGLRRSYAYSSGLSPPAARRFHEVLASFVPLRHPVTWTEGTMGGVPVVRVAPADREPLRALVYLHGGSYSMGSAGTHRDLIARLALEGFVVTVPIYRLVPEHTIADACADVGSVLDALDASGWPLRHVGLAGDSAGGGLAFLAAIARRDAGAALPAAVATIAPWVDLACPGPSMTAHEAWDWGTATALRAQGRIAAGSRALDDPTVSPTHADLRGLPPTLIHVGACELVRDDVTAFAGKLTAAGVPAERKEWPAMVHDFHVLADQHPLAREAIAHFGAWLRAHVPER